MTPRQVIDLIKSERALVKIISSPIEDDVHWKFLLNQLKNTMENRPIKQLSKNVERGIIYDPRNGKWRRRPASWFKDHDVRGHKICWGYTKKTATTLLPRDGKMYLFPASYGIGILFDINECWLGESKAGLPAGVKDSYLEIQRFNGKYIFYNNEVTDGAWWLFRGSYSTDLPRAVTLDELRQYNETARKKGKVLHHNEILSKLGHGSFSVKALFAPVEDITTRLNVQRIQLLVQLELSLSKLHLLVVTPTKSSRIYSELEQIKDIFLALSRDGIQHEIAKRLVTELKIKEKITKSLPLLTNDEAGKILCDLIKGHQYSLAKQILRYCPKFTLDYCDPTSGYNALHYAVIQDKGDLVELLITAGINILQRNRFNHRTPLSIAIYNKNFGLVKTLVETACSKSDDYAEIILCELVKMSQFELAKRLLHGYKHMKLDSGDAVTGYTALHYAVIHQQSDLVELLVRSGANIFQKNPQNERTPLSIALWNNQYDIARILIENDLATSKYPSADEVGKVICSLAKCYKFELVEQLLRHYKRVNLNICDPCQGYAALHYAVQANQIDLVKLLVKLGADILIENEQNLDTPLSEALASEKYECIKALIEGVSNKLGYSPDEIGLILGSLVKAKQFNLATQLLLRCKKVNLDSLGYITDGYSALHYAVIYEQEELIQLLIQLGANILQENPHNSRTPLSIALYNKNSRVVDNLIQYASSLHNFDMVLAELIHADESELVLKTLKGRFEYFHSITGVDKAFRYLVKKDLIDLSFIAIVPEILKKDKDAPKYIAHLYHFIIPFVLCLIENSKSRKKIIDLMEEIKPYRKMLGIKDVLSVDDNWSHLVKVAKNCILEIELRLKNKKIPSKEVGLFLNEQRNKLSFFSTKSTKIFKKIHDGQTHEAKTMLLEEKDKEQLWLEMVSKPSYLSQKLF